MINCLPQLLLIHFLIRLRSCGLAQKQITQHFLWNINDGYKVKKKQV